MTAGAGGKSILRNRNFLLLWLAYFVSASGDHLSERAILKTQHALDEGVNITPLSARMAMLFFIPFFLLGPIMGNLADRWSRRRLMVGADLARMVLMLAMIWLIAACAKMSPGWGPYFPLLLVGVFAAMFSPARSAILPTLIHTDQLVQANALLRFVGVLAAVVSTLVGGKLADLYAPSVSFQVDAVTFAVSALCVMGITAGGRPPASKRARGLWSDTLSGFHYAGGHRRVLQIFAIGAVYWLSAITVRCTVPAIVKDVYELRTYWDISLFEFYMVLGMVVGAVSLAIVRDAVRGEIAVTWSLTLASGFAACLAISALVPLPLYAAYGLGCVGVFGLGAFGATLIASYNALLQRIVPDRYLGRVFGVLDVCTIGGLLLATGLLGVPDWPNLDLWAGWLIVLVSVLLFATGLLTLVARLKQRDASLIRGFLLNLNEIVCKYWYRMRREGYCTVPATGPVLVVATRSTIADPLLMIAACRHRSLTCIVDDSYNAIPIAGWVMRRIGCIPIRDGSQGIAGADKAVDLLSHGAVVVMFIDEPDEMAGAFHYEAIAQVALKASAIVVPANIYAVNQISKIQTTGLLSRQHARMRFGKPIESLRMVSQANLAPDGVAQIASQIMVELRKLRR